MATIVTRAGKGSVLTWTEADANFTNLNNGLPETMVTAKGDLIAATASGAVDNLAVGTDGKVLTADSSSPTGLSWETPAATAADITNTPAGTIAATDVQAAINELDTDVQGHINDATAAHAASSIAFTPVGTVAATDVQSAIAEVAAEASATTVASDAIWDAKGDMVAATAANTAVRVPVGTDGYVLMADSAESAGIKWNEPGTTSAPTVQTFTSGSGTYTKPAGCTRIHVRMVGGGGGGGGSSLAANNNGGTGGTGGTSTFGTSLLTCVGGTGGSGVQGAAGAAGGTATIASPAIGAAISGGRGQSGSYTLSTEPGNFIPGGGGGSSPFFAGAGSGGMSTTAPTSGVTNTGGGGGGAGADGTAAGCATGGGGGSGGFIDAIIAAPNSTYAYAVGAAGTAGAAGTGGLIAATGAAGIIIVTEYYGNFDSVLQLNEPASTKQRFTSGSGTYTTPAGVNRIRVRMAGGGGGGAGGGTAAWGAGGNGGNTTFGSSLLTANGGTAATNYAAGGGGGTASISAPAVGIACTGSQSQLGSFSVPSGYGHGGQGGMTPFFCGGGYGGSAGSVGGVGLLNTGGGGGGGSTTNTASSAGGAGGGSGGFVDAWIWNPSGTYSYAVGAAGTAGAAGTNGAAGAAGAAGVIEVEEFYGPSHTVADTQPLSGWPGRNRIINGDFRVDQRNAGVATTATSTTYAADRWQSLDNTDGTFTTDADHASSPPPGFASYMRVAVTSNDAALAAGQYAVIQQKIEGTNCADLDFGLSTAKTVTLSFRVRSSLTGTFSGVLSNGAANRSYPFTYTISAANTWETKTVTVAGDTSGTWLTTTGIGLYVIFSLGTGSTYLGTAGAWAGSLLLGATGETPVIGTNGATWDITGVQLEPGSVRTEFERESYSEQFAKCQRYYEAGSQAIWSGMTTSGSTYYNTTTFAVAKRTAPTVTATQAGVPSGFPNTTPTLNVTADCWRAHMVSDATVATGYFQLTWSASAEL